MNLNLKNNLQLQNMAKARIPGIKAFKELLS